MKIRSVYFLLAIVGAIIPYIFFVRHFNAAGFTLTDFVTALFVTAPAGGFTADLLISSLVFWIAMFARHGRGKGPNPTLYVVLNVTIGLSCALPAYLFAMENRQNGIAGR